MDARRGGNATELLHQGADVRRLQVVGHTACLDPQPVADCSIVSFNLDASSVAQSEELEAFRVAHRLEQLHSPEARPLTMRGGS